MVGLAKARPNYSISVNVQNEIHAHAVVCSSQAHNKLGTVRACVRVCLLTQTVVPDSDRLLMLGDLMLEWVGYCKSDVVWGGVLGHHGLDVRNQVGEDFLSFYAINQLSSINTWFQKKSWTTLCYS